MATHVIIGTGAVGTATAISLTDLGHDVVMVSRRGLGPSSPGIRLVAADATDAGALRQLAQGAAVLYNCANPAYDRWATDWPPMATAMLDAATSVGADLVIMSNLYPYGPVDHPMTPADPLAATFTNGRVRAAMWEAALEAHRAGSLRVAEVRASDFFGPKVERTSHIGRALPNIMAAKTVRTFGDPDQPHTWTFVPDVGRTLAAVGTSDDAWGRAWHVPSNAPMTQRQVYARIAHLAGKPAPRVSAIPSLAIWAAGLFSGEIRAMRQVSYQFDQPFIMDATETEENFDLAATPMDEALEATITSAAATVDA